MYRDIRDIAIEQLRCGYCDAGYGQFCVTKSGARATWLHTARTCGLYSVYSSGYLDGLRDGLDNPDYARRVVGR
jgi:hypothetical protein